VNKFYFAREGGIKLCVQWMKSALSIETRASAGTAVWNFSEAGMMRSEEVRREERSEKRDGLHCV
jgi:hypothetical protein